MPDRTPALFRVSVSASDGATRSVLVRALDRASAIEEARSLGHDPIDAEQVPEEVVFSGRMCQKCGYRLFGLPQTGDGHVRCPECGKINLPPVPVKRHRTVKLVGLGCLVIALIGLGFIALIVFAWSKVPSVDELTW